MASIEQQIEALQRARTGFSKNDCYVVIMLTEAGYEDVRPRENVFTFNAWKALGRTVKKGEKGLAVTTWIPCKPTKKQKEAGEEKSLRPKTTYVFHESQTQPAGERQAQPTPEPADESFEMIVAEESDIIDVEYTIEPAPQMRLAAPKAQKQLSLF